MNKFHLVDIFYDSVFSRTFGYVQTHQRCRSLIHLIGKLRRFYLVHFRKGYVQRQLFFRRGACRQCGHCCSLLFTCPMLNRDGLCRIYAKTRWRVCQVFPVDEKDIVDVVLSGGKCGYSFGRGVAH